MKPALGICFLLASISATPRRYHPESSGRFYVTSSHEIGAGADERISILLSNVSVRSGAKFKLEDGSETWVYDSIGEGKFFKYERNNEAVKENVTAPIKFVSKTNTLAIKPRRFRTGDRFHVQYLAGQFQEGCLISQLDGESGTKTCDLSDPLYPTASSCEIRKDCGGDRFQESTTKTCDDGVWSGDVRCKLNRNTVLDRCNVSFDQAEPELSLTDCPYDLEEVADFYFEEERLGVDNVGRSHGRWACYGRCGCRKSWGIKYCILCEIAKRCRRGRQYLG